MTLAGLFAISRLFWTRLITSRPMQYAVLGIGVAFAAWLFWRAERSQAKREALLETVIQIQARTIKKHEAMRDANAKARAADIYRVLRDGKF